MVFGNGCGERAEDLASIAAMAKRRDFLTASATAAALAGLSWRGLAGQAKRPAQHVPVADEATGLPLLRLPPGFRCKSFSWSLEATDDGNVVSGLHDGMGAFVDADGGAVTLVRNHEITLAPLLAPAPFYDARCGGGTTTLRFDLRRGEWLSCRVSLAGTYKNCAGGATPWGSWLSCEETTADPATHRVEKPHGYVFEVPANGAGDAVPLASLGRFKHEAAAVDPGSGSIYLTEDEQRAGLYRFAPKAGAVGPESLRAPGALQMLAVDSPRGTPALWLRGMAAPVAWVDIDNPEGVGRNSVFRQGRARGGMAFKRLEGCCYDAGHLYFVSTSGGFAGKGQVWDLDIAASRLRLFYEAGIGDALDMPDNIAVAPGGALLLCEDRDAVPSRLCALLPSGDMATIAENNVVLRDFKGFRGDFRRAEWCGACWVGDWLFANLQKRGITFAITGPWEEIGVG